MKINKEGYYELTISDGRQNHSFITLEDQTTGTTKKIKIVASYNKGILTEMISWEILKYVKNVREICDRRVYKNKKGMKVVEEILPEGEYFHYHSDPCYQKAREISQEEAFSIIQTIKETPNGIKQYRDKITKLIYASTQNFEIAKKNLRKSETEETIEETATAESHNDRITEPGYYKLTLTDGEFTHSMIETEDKNKVYFIGEYKEGVMTIAATEIQLAYVRDVEEIQDRRVFEDGIVTDILEKDDYHSYYSSPCYLKAQRISNKIALKHLETLTQDSRLLKNYIYKINTIIQSATKDYQTVKTTPFVQTRKKKKSKKVQNKKEI